ncbi:type II toxin-antitoxin system PemK/MazF family toxin [Enterovirga rhinocerotis]|uniref:Transcriptional modulator of MazE/toxin MazF n=1 Tax=Enterovirga rhinocerotis TaxID=1339210 RepID=A0A4R7BVG7_9HYPH|nr:type II toxin-antitoxin system PemK/MazF family toxin [Enterovirga rhinocerotis]TDR89062.1 transcriptional modulator of MazE/toxin MazF [Enterovirga rhinocerotis]
MAALPRAGDVIWVELDPVLGTEQAGRRPALVLSDEPYHAVSTRAVICPISNRGRGWPFEVPLPPEMKTKGVVLVDQVRAVHQASRLFAFVEAVPASVLAEVRGRLAGLVGIKLMEDQDPR